MEPADILDSKVLGLLKAGTAHLLDAKSGVPGEDLHQYLYLQAERSSSDTTPRQMELLCYLDAATKARGLVFKQASSKLAGIPEIFGLLCKDDGVPVARAKLFIKLMFGETHPKTKTLLEEICLGAVGVEEEGALGLKHFETYMKALLLAKEASDVAGDVFDHLVLLKGAKAKVELPPNQELRRCLLQVSRDYAVPDTFPLHRRRTR